MNEPSFVVCVFITNFTAPHMFKRSIDDLQIDYSSRVNKPKNFHNLLNQSGKGILITKQN